MRRILIAGSLLACVLTSSDLAGQPEGQEVKVTIERIRQVGHTMFSWWIDNTDRQEGVSAQHVQPEVDLERIGLIEADELEELLVPDYLEFLPRSDGWGKPLEFRLAPSAPGSYVMSVRSSGRDGKYSGTVYESGGFSPSNEGADTVWIDLYFSRWPVPERDKGK